MAAAVRSALAQIHCRVEIIVVNDGSRDETLAAARSVTDPRVTVLDQANRGAAAARNVGLRAAQGEFIQFLDADDLLAPEKIELQIRRLSDRPDCVASGRWGRFRTDPGTAIFVPEPFWQDMAPVDWLASVWERCSMMHPAAWLVPRSLSDAADLWDESLSLDDDGEYFTRVALEAKTVLFCDAAVSFYRSGLTNSLSGLKSAAAWDSQFRSLSSRAERILSAVDSPRTRRACCRAFEEFVYGSYPDVPALRAQAWERVRELGGPYFQPQMGPKLRAASRVIGWKLAKRVQRFTRPLRVG